MIYVALKILLSPAAYARLLAPPDKDGRAKRFPGEPLRRFRARQVDAVLAQREQGTD